MRKISRRKKLRVAKIAIEYGVPPHIAHSIAFIAPKKGVGFSLAFALVEQESGFRHIFGHDVGGPFPGKKVTRKLFKKLVEKIKKGRISNGVGLLQITYYGYILAHPSIWKINANLKAGFGILKDNIKRYGERKGLGVYNGGPSNPQYDYADSVLTLKKKWHSRFEKK